MKKQKIDLKIGTKLEALWNDVKKVQEARLAELEKETGDCILYQVYKDRIGELKTQGKIDSWDGVFKHTTKQ